MTALIRSFLKRNDAILTAPLRTSHSQSRQYRARAYHCQGIAARWSNSLVRQQYEDIARQWFMLAEQAEANTDA
jgi:hypothetical protein